MEVLAPLDFTHHHYSTHRDWTRPNQSSTGLVTPISSTSQTSLDSFTRPRSWAIDVKPDRPSLKGTAAMSPSQSPKKTYSDLRSTPSMTTRALPPNEARPSLPPIRALLAEPLASPPATPVAARTSLQYTPHDRDNDYERRHKRACSSITWERRTLQASPASVQSLASFGADSMSRRDSATQATYDYASYRSGKAYQPHERLGSAFLPELKTAVPTARTASPEYGHGSHARPPVARKRSFDSMSVPTHHDRPSMLPGIGLPTPQTQSRAARPMLGDPTSSSYRLYSGPSTVRPDLHTLPPPAFPTALYHPVADPSASSMHARPAMYDYTLGKSRKRSNLPKESTDIMKRWFEEHLDNPYPSEEEKKHFAQQAGINTTQVSNWFINHRRRCPELKEQRDKKPAVSVGKSTTDDHH